MMNVNAGGVRQAREEDNNIARFNRIDVFDIRIGRLFDLIHDFAVELQHEVDILRAEWAIADIRDNVYRNIIYFIKVVSRSMLTIMSFMLWYRWGMYIYDLVLPLSDTTNEQMPVAGVHASEVLRYTPPTNCNRWVCEMDTSPRVVTCICLDTHH